MKRPLSLCAALAVASGVFVAAGSSGAGASYPPLPAGPIVVGATTPLSGPTAAYGESTEESFNGVTMKAFNAEFPNGIDGHPVKLVFLDDQGTVTGGVQTAEQLVADKVAAVVTLSYNPEATDQQAEIINKAHIPLIAGLAGNNAYYNASKWPYYFSIEASPQEEAAATVKWIKNSGFKRVAVLDDGLQETDTVLSDLQTAIKSDHGAKVVTVQQISPAATEVSAQIAAIKAANPDLIYIDTGEAYGPIWQSMITDGLTSTKILASAGAWYDSFSAMGPLEANAYAVYDNCATSATQTWPANVESLMAQYNAATYGYSTNYLTYVATDTVPLLLLRAAIDKEHSDSPAAVAAGLLAIHNQVFDGVTINYTSANHAGLAGTDGAAVCKMGPPYAGGLGKVPVQSTKA
jgi:branched-chain amino acid transport system substrate-binding protein